MGDNIFTYTDGDIANIYPNSQGALTREMLDGVDPIGWPEGMRETPKQRVKMPYEVIIDAFQDDVTHTWIKITDADGRWALTIEYDHATGCWNKMNREAHKLPKRIATLNIQNKDDDKDGIANVHVILQPGCKLEWGMNYEDVPEWKYIYNRVHDEQYLGEDAWGIAFESRGCDCDGERSDGWNSISYGGPIPSGGGASQDVAWV